MMDLCVCIGGVEVEIDCDNGDIFLGDGTGWDRDRYGDVKWFRLQKREQRGNNGGRNVECCICWDSHLHVTR